MFGPKNKSDHQYINLLCSLYQVFPLRAPMDSANSTALADIQEYLNVDAGLGRSAVEQGGYQMLALVVTLIVAIVSGMITGM